MKSRANDTEPGLVEETIRIKEQPGNENDLEPSETIADQLDTTKTQLSAPDQVFVNVQIVHTSRRISKTVIVDIGDLLSKRNALGKSKNGKILLSILSSFRYLARQALPLGGGDWNTEV